MAYLMGHGEIANQIAEALKVPKNTRSVVFKMQPNRVATLEVEILVDQEDIEHLATIFKRYRLEEIQEPPENKN